MGYQAPASALVPACQNPDNTPTSSTSISIDVNDRTISPSTHSDYMESVHTLVKSPSTAPTLGTSAAGLEIQTSEDKAALTYSASRTISPPAIGIQTSLGFGTQTITANSKSQNNFDSGRTLSSGLETSSAGSEFQPFSSKTTPMNFPNTSTAGAESIIPFISGSDTSLSSLLSPATAAPALPATPATLTIGGNAMTANTFAHFNINNQTHRPDSAITASDTMISLTPDQSDVVVRTHTGVSGANFTADLASGPKTTGAQIFKGTAVGAKDELCNSSMVMLIVIAILLWLR